MGRSTIPPALIELSNPSTPEAQVNALRSLKNEIVGHEQRKELAVEHGVVRPLAGLLRAETRKGGKRRKGVTNGSRHTASGASKKWDAVEWSTEDELRFQATLVVGSLANGGPAFIAPLLAGNVLPPLLEALSPNETPPKLIVAILRTLNQIVDSVAQEKPWVDWSDNSARSSLSYMISEQVYSKSVIESLAEILDQSSRSSTCHQQISLTMKLVIKTCREESQRKVLLEAGILELLSAKLASIASMDQPNNTQDARNRSTPELPRMYLSEVLEAISTIIRDSYYHTSRFLYSQSIQSLFGWPKERSASSYNDYTNSSSSTTWDKLIPRVQTMTSKADPYTKSWPALGSYTPAATGDNYTRLPSMESFQQQSTGRNLIMDEPETPLFIWLMYVARQGEGRERLSACWLLALLKKFGDRWPLNDPPKTTRERHFSYLIIPLVVKMIEEANPTSEHARRAKSLSPAAKEESRFILERSPLVLAELVTGNKALQTAAVDARILPVLVQILKKSFEPITTSSKPLWQPKGTAPQMRDPMIDPASSTLGKAGLNEDMLHAYRYRESSLLALAAIADTQDGLRKHVIEMGAATHIIDSLVPYSDNMDTGTGSTSSKDGNPEPVLIAACMVTRSLSRSISVLRTSLIDHGIAQPSFDLLTHPNVKVQIAATEVITNLVLEVSPMRTEIIEAGALKTLCEHCRSANFDLRYGSLWALKHLCLGLPYTMKIQCLEELGVGWLVQVLNGEPSKPSTILGMGTSNAAGEQVDILNAAEDPHMDVDEDPSSEEDEDTMADNIQVNVRRHQRPESRYTTAATIRDRLQTIKNDEQDARLNSERDDIRIQEQALDFIRNFITEEKTSGEMIDHLLKTFGHSRFFELLDAKIRPKNSAATTTAAAVSTPQAPAAPSYWASTAQRSSFSSPASSLAQGAQQQQPNWAAYPATELISATVYILVHLANGRPTHRSLLISQTQLMTHILPLLGHPRREVRLPCAWFLNNLVWVDNNADEPASRERAQNLRQLGFEEGARQLGRDSDLDIRERAKTAIEQLGKLLGDAIGRGSAAAGGYGSPAGTSFGGGDGSGGGLGSMSSRLGGLHGHRHGGWGHDSRG